MIRDSKHSDIKHHRFDEANFVDYDHLFNLIQEAGGQCYYCNCEVQYIELCKNQGTIERLDNTVGHIKGNCVIACAHCNKSRVGDKRKRE